MSPESEVELELGEIPPIKSTQGQQLYGVPENSDKEYISTPRTSKGNDYEFLRTW